jgi:UDP-N-acetyl-D-mannosaminuronic acid transferase (WecB/TagA/CpsF family)
MQSMGLEWLHRLGREPQRLGKRYAADFIEFARLLADQQ